MTEYYGAETLPVAAPVGTATVSDKALDVLAAWMSAVITYECATAWAAVAPNEPIVRTYQTQDPGGQDFRETDLPALFLFRTQSTPQHFADDHWGAESLVTMLFVFPPAEQSKAARRMAIFNGLQKAVHRALGPCNGRHPAWVVTGDTDPFAAQYGSSILTHGGLIWCAPNPWNLAEVRIDPMREPYDAIRAEFRIREEYAQGDTGIETSDVLSTITANSAFVQVTEQKL